MGGDHEDDEEDEHHVDSGVTLISAMTLRSPARLEELIIAMASPFLILRSRKLMNSEVSC